MVIQIGRSNSNLAIIKKLNPSSSIASIVPEEVLYLFRQNKALESSRFEMLRAKVISIVIGGAFPFAILALLGTGTYQVFKTGILVPYIEQIVIRLCLGAQRVFAAIHSSSSITTASIGGVVTASYLLTREPVYTAIGSFLGIFAGSNLANLFRKLQYEGYYWWYDQYRFTERAKIIEENKQTIVVTLKTVYDGMGTALMNASQKVQSNESLLIKDAEILKEKIPVVRALLRKRGVSERDSMTITLGFQSSIGSILDCV